MGGVRIEKTKKRIIIHDQIEGITKNDIRRLARCGEQLILLLFSHLLKSWLKSMSNINGMIGTLILDPWTKGQKNPICDSYIHLVWG